MIEARLIKDRDTWLKWREEHMTASVAACLFGADVQPGTSAYLQWAYKSGLATQPPIDPKLARRGFYVEKIAPAILKDEQPFWHASTNRDYYCDPEERIGATPDLWATRPDIKGVGVIDVKSLGNRAFSKWRDRETGNTELPVWMQVQVNIQAGLMSEEHGEPITWGAVLAITIGDQGLDAEIFNVEIFPGIFQTFRRLAADFWRRVKEKDPYPINWKTDADTVLDMYRDEGGIIDLSDDVQLESTLALRAEYKRIELEGALAEKSRRTIDAQLLHKLGNATGARTKSGLMKAQIVRVKEAVRKAYQYPKITVTGYEARDNLPAAEPLD